MAINIKELSTKQAIRIIMRLLPKVSDDNFARLVHLSELLTNEPFFLNGLSKVRGYLETPGHPAKELFRRILTCLPAERKIRLFETLFNGPFLRGQNSGVSGKQKQGFDPLSS